MDLLLAHAYHLYDDPVEASIMRPYAPLGLLYNAAYLKRAGLNVTVFDATFRRPEEFEALLRLERPPVVGIYVNMLTKRPALKMIAAARAEGSLVVLGGPEPPAHAADFLEAGADVIVVGEGELTLAALIPHLREKGTVGLEQIDGIVFRRPDGSLCQTASRPKIKDLDSLPWPDRGAIDLQEYLEVWRRHHGRGSISLITARGCPFKCSWCSHAVYGHTHRRRSPKAVVDEIVHIRDTYHPEMLWIADDVFTINARWTLQWAAEMKARGIRIPYECITRADCLSEPVMAALADTGCYRVWFGSESGSERILKAMDRGVSNDEIRQAVRWGRRHGVETGLFIMLGYDGETEEDIAQTIDHLKVTGADTYLLTVAYPIKGTTFHQRLGERVIPAPHWHDSNDRDSRYRGRPSDRFFRFAVMRVQEEVRLHRLLQDREIAPVQALKSLVRSRVARAGMMLTRNLNRY